MKGTGIAKAKARNTCWSTTARTEATLLSTTYILADDPLFPYRILFSPTVISFLL